MPLNLPKRSGLCDARTEQRAEERVTGGRRAEGAGARDEPRPGAVAPLRVDRVEERDAGPEQRVLDERSLHALLHAAPADRSKTKPNVAPAAACVARFASHSWRPRVMNGPISSASQYGVPKAA